MIINAILDEIDREREAIKRLNERNQELYQLYQFIGCHSNVEEISLWMAQKKAHQDSIDNANQRLGKYTNQLEQYKEEKEKTKKLQDAALEKQSAAKEALCYYDFASEGVGILESVEKEIADEVRTKLEQATFEYFDKFIWKSETYGKIKLTEDYKVQLFTKDTDKLCKGSCSAAEKELLALAFTLAIHTVSERDALLYIDTPVGRISDVNRENFAEFLANASMNKQIILAFTPSEFSEEIARHFPENILASKYYLDGTDERSTKIRG